MRAGSRAMGAMVLVAALAAAGCTDSTEAEPKIQITARPGIAPTPPGQGAFFGAWVQPAGGGPSYKDPAKPEAAEVSRFEKELGRKLDIVQTYRGWDEPVPKDPGLLNGTHYLLLSWRGGDTREIATTREDRLIRERAREIKATGKPIFLRWEDGMDETSAAVRRRIHSPADYVAAWKHLREIFRQEKVDNVAWVWCPTAKGFGADNAPAHYPGDDQVDWICANVYPGGNYDYRDLSEAAKLFLQWAKQRPKPIMVGEFGAPRSYGGRRAEWLRNAAEHLQSPQIKAVVYYNSDADSDRRRLQFSVTGDRPALSALRELATTPFFNPRNLPVTSG